MLSLWAFGTGISAQHIWQTELMCEHEHSCLIVITLDTNDGHRKHEHNNALLSQILVLTSKMVSLRLAHADHVPVASASRTVHSVQQERLRKHHQARLEQQCPALIQQWLCNLTMQLMGATVFIPPLRTCCQPSIHEQTMLRHFQPPCWPARGDLLANIDCYPRKQRCACKVQTRWCKCCVGLRIDFGISVLLHVEASGPHRAVSFART